MAPGEGKRPWRVYQDYHMLPAMLNCCIYWYCSHVGYKRSECWSGDETAPIVLRPIFIFFCLFLGHIRTTRSPWSDKTQNDGHSKPVEVSYTEEKARRGLVALEWAHVCSIDGRPEKGLCPTACMSTKQAYYQAQNEFFYLSAGEYLFPPGNSTSSWRWLVFLLLSFPPLCECVVDVLDVCADVRRVSESGERENPTGRGCIPCSLCRHLLPWTSNTRRTQKGTLLFVPRHYLKPHSPFLHLFTLLLFNSLPTHPFIDTHYITNTHHSQSPLSFTTAALTLNYFTPTQPLTYTTDTLTLDSHSFSHTFATTRPQFPPKPLDTSIPSYSPNTLLHQHDSPAQVSRNLGAQDRQVHSRSLLHLSTTHILARVNKFSCLNCLG